ncbi:MAG TPA: hypothetical protein VFP54_06040 [Acidimicrobiales bacterium]|nr:hypothetical protein [Acidimicrobiales bacterium]
MRVSWHAAEGLAVLSLWREDPCIGTYRATPADLAEVVSCLAGVLVEAAEAPARFSETA